MINFTIFLVLITIVSFLLIIVVMVQNPKGGGLSSSLGGPQVMGGVQKTTDFLDKSTWTLAAILVCLILFSSLSFSTSYSGEDSLTDDAAVPAKQTTPANGAPVAPATPAAQPVTPAPAPAAPAQ